MIRLVSKDAYQLVHQGTLALAEVERHGLRIDTQWLDASIKRVSEQQRKLEAQLKTSDVWKEWKKRFGARASLSSRAQLGTILFDVLGIECPEYTKTGRPKTSEDVLESVELPFVKDYLKLEKLRKLYSTYLMGLKHEVQDGYLHPSYNLHLARSFRSSCDKPNFQNIPIRDKEIGKLVRRCFVPRPGRVLVEVDYSGHEFRIAACHWRDKRMVSYASDSSLDIHRDMAAVCFELPVERVSKEARFYAKNQFVFPMLYGSWWKSCARNLWTMVETAGIKTADGVPIREHLESVGIHTFEDFERHIEYAEGKFKEHFPQWTERSEIWWNAYVKRGGFRVATGFWLSGVYSRNQVMNMPIQGPAFHCLLWSLIQLVRELRKRRMRTVVVGQIHDSILADVCKEELDDYLAMVKRIMEGDVRRHWPWIVVPLKIEAMVAENNWFEKHEVEI